MPARIVTIAVLALCLAAPCAAGAEPEATPSTAPMERAVDQLIEQWAGSGTPGASIAVIENGKIIYSKGYGSANLEYGVPNTRATVFDLASVSKQFTAFATKPSLDDKQEVAIDPKVLDAYVGDYELRPGIIVSFSKDKDHLVWREPGRSSFPMYAVSNTVFRLRVVPVEVVFDDPTEDGKNQNAVWPAPGFVDKQLS